MQAYIEKGFAWVGITEHIPPVSDRFLYPEEIEAGLDAAAMYGRFRRYIVACRRLQETYAPRLRIFVGFETEMVTGYEAHVRELVQTFQPDYMVGSLHHVNDLPFDLSEAHYRRAAAAVGGIEALYCRYFDQQAEMLEVLRPQVVGHFDYIRLFDPHYPARLQRPEIWARVRRNLARIKELGLMLDYNVYALRKGSREPFVSAPILEEALALGIPLAPGDDSHGLDSVGLNVAEAIRRLQAAGADTRWRLPA